MLIGKYSSSAHELMLQFLSVRRTSCSVVRRERADVPLQRLTRERARNPEGPWERSATKRQGETLGRGVQVRPTAREPARRIGDDLEAGPGVLCDNSQQLLPGSPPATPQARADGFRR